jgi:hypothetical protein
MGSRKEDFELIIEYVRGRLSPEERARVEKLIAGDPALQEMAAILSDARDEIDFTGWRSMQKPSLELFTRLLKDSKKSKRDAAGHHGVTIFDSGLLPLPEGVRSAAVDTRRLKYLIGETELEISLYPVSPDSYELIGLLSGQEDSETLDVDLRGGKLKLKARANQFKLFRFPRVPAGRYDLIIREGRRVVGKVSLEL